MSIGVIGNSHTVAIKAAFNSGRADSLTEVDFYPMLGDWKIEIENNLDGRNLLFKRDKGPDIDPGKFECIVFSACGLVAARNKFVETNNPPTHPLGYLACADWGYHYTLVPHSVKLVSAAVFRATIQAWVRQQALVQLAMSIAGRYSYPVIMQPWPAPNRKLKTDADWVLNRWYGSNGPHAWLDFFRAEYAALKVIAQELGPQFIVLDYPVPGPLGDGFMSEHWCHPDPFHANHRYGNLVLKQIKEALSRTS
jgi:hypothetical protein